MGKLKVKLSRFSSLLIENKNRESQEKFKIIIDTAKKILEGPHPGRIFDYIYTLGKPTQFQRIVDCIDGSIKNNNDSGIDQLFMNISPIESRNLYELLSYKTLQEDIQLINPSKYLIFSYPWNQERLFSAFMEVGNEVGNPWEHQDLNHRLTMIDPIKIGVIDNGNHSATMNIISNEAQFKATQYVDLEPWFSKIYSDGVHFKSIADHKVIGRVTSLEMAAIFEIGRLLIQNDRDTKLSY